MARGDAKEGTGRIGPSFLRANGLSLALLALFLGFLAAQVWSGFHANNAERATVGAPPLELPAYLTSGHFISATFENWESEFLQMAMYVLLTVVLRQRGSAESRPLDPEEEDPSIDDGPQPWPARAGGWLRTLYGHSLAITLGLLFLISFLLHAWGSWLHQVDERVMKHETPQSLLGHVTNAQFWFESFQNWQSEFLAVLVLVVLSIWLRQKDSPQSKPVDAPHSQTGT